MLRIFVRMFFVSVIFCFLVSCSLVRIGPKEIKANHVSNFTLHIDDKFTTAEREVVIDSFAEWERDTHGVVSFVVSTVKWNSSTDEVHYSFDKNRCTADVYVASITGEHESVQEFEKHGGGSKGNTLGYTIPACDTKFVAFIMDRIKIRNNPKLLREVGVHEAGHLIGLDHIPVPNESIMFPSASHMTKKPTRLDMAQFCLIYGCNVNDMHYE